MARSTERQEGNAIRYGQAVRSWAWEEENFGKNQASSRQCRPGSTPVDSETLDACSCCATCGDCESSYLCCKDLVCREHGAWQVEGIW